MSDFGYVGGDARDSNMKTKMSRDGKPGRWRVATDVPGGNYPNSVVLQDMGIPGGWSLSKRCGDAAGRNGSCTGLALGESKDRLLADHAADPSIMFEPQLTPRRWMHDFDGYVHPPPAKVCLPRSPWPISKRIPRAHGSRSNGLSITCWSPSALSWSQTSFLGRCVFVHVFSRGR